jgi:hypothetical protein
MSGEIVIGFFEILFYVPDFTGHVKLTNPSIYAGGDDNREQAGL